MTWSVEKVMKSHERGMQSFLKGYMVTRGKNEWHVVPLVAWDAMDDCCQQSLLKLCESAEEEQRVVPTLQNRSGRSAGHCWHTHNGVIAMTYRIRRVQCEDGTTYVLAVAVEGDHTAKALVMLDHWKKAKTKLHKALPAWCEEG